MLVPMFITVFYRVLMELFKRVDASELVRRSIDLYQISDGFIRDDDRTRNVVEVRYYIHPESSH